jgi:hypothetical protein
MVPRRDAAVLVDVARGPREFERAKGLASRRRFAGDEQCEVDRAARLHRRRGAAFQRGRVIGYALGVIVGHACVPASFDAAMVPGVTVNVIRAAGFRSGFKP